MRMQEAEEARREFVLVSLNILPAYSANVMNVIKGLMLLLCLDWILICIEEHERGKKIVCQQKEELIQISLLYRIARSR